MSTPTRPGGGTRPVSPRPTQSRRGMLLAGLVVAAVVAVVVATMVQQQRGAAPVNPDYGTTQAAVRVQDGVVRVGADDAPVTLDVYEDFLCPACADFESQHGGALAQALDTGALAVRVHLVDFLSDRSASGDYSRRAAAAALCVAADADGSAYPEFHRLLYSAEVFPAEGGEADLTDEQLTAHAVQAGASDAVRGCISDGSELATVDAVTGAAITDLGAATDSVGTPTVLRDGQVVNRTDRDWVAQLS